MRVLLADDQPEVRRALRVLLKRREGLSVVGEAVDAGDLMVQSASARPDLVLLDWELPGFGGKEMLSALRTLCPGATVVALSGRPEARRAAMQAGADAFASKGDPPESLLMAVNGFASGHGQA